MTNEKQGITRRTMVKGAAWSAPVVAAAVALPLAAASTTDIGAFSVGGNCGLPGETGAGFDLIAGSGPVPAGTTITISGTGASDIGTFTIFGAPVTVTVVSPTERIIELTGPLPAGTELSMRSDITLGTDFSLTTLVTLPTGYTGTGSKPTGTVTSTTTSCTAG